MNFEEFKKRYIAKLMKSGLYQSQEEIENDAEFNDRMAEMYLGFMVYSEWQNEYAKAAHEKAKREALIQAKKKQSKIIVPGAHH